MSVGNINEATEFYRGVLGLTHLFSAPPGLAFFSAGTVRLMLVAPENPAEPPKPNSTLYFRVPDIHAARTALVERGVRFEGEPHCIARMPNHDLWMAFLRDPDRNLIGIMSEVPR